MPEKIDPKILSKEIKGKIREFYPYFLGFYVLSLIIAYFSPTWSGFFYWPAFHGAVIVFALFFIWTFKFDLTLIKNYLHWSGVQLQKYFIFVRSRLLRLSRRTWLKIFLVAAVLIFTLLKGIGAIDFLVLLYALVSIFFVLDSRWSAAASLTLLASCPMLLILKKGAWAENIAVYAYYFLVITVLTQIRELKKEKLPVDNRGLDGG